MDNVEIIKQLHKNFAAGNMQAVFSLFDKDVTWVRPGEPDIPFAGTFKGPAELAKMFGIISQSIKIKGLHPKEIFGQGETVVVIGEDTAEVITTGKSYRSEWVYVYKLKDGKIIFVQVYLDSLLLAKAFQS